MHVSVTFRHMESSDAIRGYAEEKTERLAKYLFEPAEIHWVLSVEKIRHIADVTITANGVTTKAQGDTQDMYSAIDTVLDKLENQLRKHKERVKDHKPHTTEPASKMFPSVGAVVAGKPRIVKKDNQFLKPMSVEEAAMQMDVAGHKFLVFTDSVTSGVNVIYRTEDDNYCLIETRTK